MKDKYDDDVDGDTDHDDDNAEDDDNNYDNDNNDDDDDNNGDDDDNDDNDDEMTTMITTKPDNLHFFCHQPRCSGRPVDIGTSPDNIVAWLSWLSW